MAIDLTIPSCPLCGELDHPGRPCYALLRQQWKREDFNRWIDGFPKDEVIELKWEAKDEAV